VAHAFNFVFLEFSLVFGTILPYHDAFSMHAIFQKVTFIYFFTLCEKVLSFSMELPIYKVAFIKVSVKLKFALACLFALFELT
jgi:hypothetical protein